MGIFKVEHFVDCVGKYDPLSKRIISWTYAIAGDASGSNGLEEHRVVLTWSVNSGKRKIEIDGLEEFFTIAKGSIIDQKISTSYGHELRIVGTTVAPDNAASIFRFYELLINGRSFLSFPEASHARGSGLTHYPKSCGNRPSSILQILYPDQDFDGSATEERPHGETSPQRRTAQETTQYTAYEPAPAVSSPAAEVDLLDFSEPTVPDPVAQVATLTDSTPIHSEKPSFEAYQKTPPFVPSMEPIDPPTATLTSDPTNYIVNDNPFALPPPQNPPTPTPDPFAVPTQATGTLKPQVNEFQSPNPVPSIDLLALNDNDTRDDRNMVSQTIATEKTGKVVFDPFA